MPPGLRGVGAAHADLAGHLTGVEALAVANLPTPPRLLNALQRTARRLADRVWPAAAGVGGLQCRELVGGWLAVAGRLAPQRRQWNGEALTLIGWSQRMGIRVETLLRRCRKGWSVEQVLTTPPEGGR